MANQIVVSSGAKVRDLNDVIIGTSGVLSSLAFNVSNGVPKLDVNGKILVSQLPNSVMEYLGTWNAATNTPFLVNGTGNAGDVYLCNVAGTVDFGAGPISFVVSDQVIYSGSIWQKASGSNGTVTSVGLTSTGNDAITITGSPITTSGNINLGFAGTNLQYINGAGDLTTFPTLISSIGLSMPSAFNVSNSPLTANGTIGVTGAGVASQYIRGDGTLADFPTSGGGGSSVSYYLNGGTSQGVIGGITYYEMSKIAVIGTGVDFPKTGDGLIVSFLTDAGDPAQLNIPAGNWNYEIYASMSANGGTPELYAELYVYDGTTFTLIGTSSNEILYDGTTLNLYTFAMAVPATTLAITDRLAVKLYATNSGGKTTTVHTQDGHLCQIITTFSTGITALNGLTAQVQYFATGTSGTDFAINSSTATHTFNLPVASASNTGKLSSTDWSTFNAKQPAGNYVTLDTNQTITAVKTFNTPVILNNALNLTFDASVTAIANNFAIYANKISNYSILSLYDTDTAKYSKLYFDNTTNRTYTFPTASGTIALTSDIPSLTGYVPYTGATANVTLGAFDLSADDVTLSSNLASLTRDVVNSIGILRLQKGANGYIQPSTLSVDRTYTLPDATGTIALTSNLSSYLPLSGGTLTGLLNGTSADFSSSVSALELLLDSAGTASATFVKNTNGTGVISTGSNQIGFNLNNAFFISSDNKGCSIFSFNHSSSAYTYTLPSANGTIALTTDLGSYLPLAGGTLTGALNGTSAVFSSTVQASAYRLTGMTGGSGALYWSSDRVTLANYNATGVVNIEANGGTSVATFGGATYNNDFVGTLRNTTSAYFATTSGNVGIGNSSPSYTLDVSGSLRSTNTAYFATTSGVVGIGTTSVNASTILAVAGSNTVTDARGMVSVNSTNASAADLGGSISLGGENGLGTSPYAFAKISGRKEGAGATYSGYLSLATTFSDGTITERMIITSAGNVGIGTSSPSYRLVVNSGTDGVSAGIAGSTYGIRFDNGGTFSSGMSTIHGVDSTLTGSYQPIMINGSDVRFGTSATERMRITSGGNVGIGYIGYSQTRLTVRGVDSSTSNYAFRVENAATSGIIEIRNDGQISTNLGTGTVYSTGGVLSVVSDMNLKIEDGFIDNALEKVLKLKPRYFHWKEESKLPNDLRQLGFYAQEVNEALGEEAANTPKENEYFGINDRAIIAYLAKAIQEMNTKIDEQNQTIQNLQEQINILAK